MPKPFVGLNELGRRVGEDHPAAVLTDHEVDLMRRLHEDPIEPLGYRRLSRLFNVPRSQVQRICTYRCRAQHPTRFKRR